MTISNRVRVMEKVVELLLSSLKTFLIFMNCRTMMGVMV